MRIGEMKLEEQVGSHNWELDLKSEQWISLVQAKNLGQGKHPGIYKGDPS